MFGVNEVVFQVIYFDIFVIRQYRRSGSGGFLGLGEEGVGEGEDQLVRDFLVFLVSLRNKFVVVIFEFLDQKFEFQR